jgi:hypothetical protein
MYTLKTSVLFVSSTVYVYESMYCSNALQLTRVSAYHCYVQALGLMHSTHTSSQQPRLVVLVGPWEHHSNLLPWRESCAEVITIRDIAWSQPTPSSTTTVHNADSSSSSNNSDTAGSSCSMQGGQSGIDMQHLEDMLRLHSNRGGLLIGAFSAASNLTGVLCDMNAITGNYMHYTMLNVLHYLTQCNVLASSFTPIVDYSETVLVQSIVIL